jgi:2-dehydro-3-deoxygluconokinase
VPGGDVEVVVIGEALITLAPEGARLLGDTDLLTKSISGAEVNTAVGLARLGRSVAVLGCVGDDPFGEQIRRELHAEGVDVSRLMARPGRTGLIVKERPDDQHAVSRYYRQDSPASRMGLDDIDLDVVVAADRVHLTGITPAIGARPRALVRELLTVLAPLPVRVSFDVNMRAALWSPESARLELLDYLPMVDELLCNEEEAALLVGAADVETMLQRLAGLGPPAVVVKQGAEGASAFVDGEVIAVPAVHAPAPVDPVGAGDAFNAGWLFGRLAGLPPRTCLVAGAWVASHVVQSLSDSAACPRLPEWQEFLHSHGSTP